MFISDILICLATVLILFNYWIFHKLDTRLKKVEENLLGWGRDITAFKKDLYKDILLVQMKTKQFEIIMTDLETIKLKLFNQFNMKI